MRERKRNKEGGREGGSERGKKGKGKEVKERKGGGIAIFIHKDIQIQFSMNQKNYLS